MCSLYKQIKKLTKITLNLIITVGKLTGFTEISISRQLTSLSNQRASLATQSPIIKAHIAFQVNN